MKLKLFSIALVLGLFSLASCSQDKVSLKTKADSVSYCMGVSVGKNYLEGMKREKVDSLLNKDLIVQGMKDVFKSRKTAVKDSLADMIVQMYFQELQTKKREADAKKFEAKNKVGGEKFLAENKTKAGVQVTASGLQYIVLKEGNGPKATKDDVVKVHYVGTTLEGKEFDSSIKRGQPAEFGVTGVIPGWTEALQLMNVGSKYKLFIPYNLGYGDKGAGGVIEPYAVLIFEVELIEIVKKDAKK